ncbi:MAG: hypothetical protein ABIU87_07640 [Ornithinibacter sp.]
MSGMPESARLEQARSAIAQGAPWRARDLLVRHLEGHRDPEALALLGEVYQLMGDLPAAGAVWFSAGVTGPDVDTAVAAWRERSHDDFPAMWRSLPASVRADPQSARVKALRDRARGLDASIDEPGSDRSDSEASGPDHRADVGHPGEDDEGGLDAAQFIAWLAAAAFVACGVIGLVTVLQWLVPG